jgi:hypothetical protein
VGCPDALACSTVGWSALLTGAVVALQSLAYRSTFFAFMESNYYTYLIRPFKDKRSSSYFRTTSG